MANLSATGMAAGAGELMRFPVKGAFCFAAKRHAGHNCMDSQAGVGTLTNAGNTGGLCPPLDPYFGFLNSLTFRDVSWQLATERMMHNPAWSILGLIGSFACSGFALVGCGETEPPTEQSTESATSGGSNAGDNSTSTTKASSAAKGGASAKTSTKATNGSGGTSSTTEEPSEATGGRSIAGDAATAGTSSRRSSRGTGGTTAVAGTKAVGGATAAVTGGATSSPASGGASSTGPATTERFSFFVMSYAAIIDLSGSDEGFGGDLRYGQADGLAGADKICTEVAERGMPKNGKTWRAFLSTTNENAIDRIGEGPWYDRRGRVFAMTKADLLHTRPLGADTAIINDFPNENGVTNHNPDGTQVDNHDMLTGSGIDGKIYKATATCSDWTSSAADTSKKPRVGHSWPRSGGRGSTSGSSDNVAGMAHWISALDESGCAPGQYQPTAGQYDGPPGTDGTVGSGGGYGGFYCFALTP
ncbi:MAG TPA: hypothetical protein VKP30_06485 [Polyangiaceae bacterium]|nr:hypothetical protein [Polyangiaceae bacterium]